MRGEEHGVGDLYTSLGRAVKDPLVDTFIYHEPGRLRGSTSS